uniref:Tail protein n=1 Tax=Dulem virus 32 TaxID=3145750 RepID=A0AAU8B0P7_9CAUD
MTEYWSIDLLDRDDNRVAPFGRCSGGSLDWSISRAIHGGGTLEIDNPPSDIDWLTARLRITHHLDDHATPMGVWLPTWPEWAHDATTRKASVQVLDKTAILAREIGARLQIEAGTVVTDRVAEIITARGEEALALTPSGKVLRSTITWDPKDTWLKAINDMLSAIGYGALWVDANGWYRAEPWRAPSDRPLIATYGGDHGDYRVLRTYKDSANLADIPNVLVALSKTSQDEPSLRGVARLDDPTHPLSSARRGEIVRVVDNLEAADQAVIDQHARRLLAEATEVTRRITYTHPVDDVQLRDRIHLRRFALDGVVVNRAIKLDIGPIVEDTARHIYTQGEPLWI